MRPPLSLCYHAVSEDWPAALSISPQRLRAHLELVVSRGYEAVGFSDAVAEPSPNRIAITFDDAFASVLDIALPIFDELGMVATVFVPTAYPSFAPLSWDGTSHWARTGFEPELAPMSWSQLRELSDRGWEIGSHTHTHPRLTQLDDATLERELVVSHEVCEAEMGYCRSIAYPYGDCDGRVFAMAARAGYQAGATLPIGIPRECTALSVPRIGVYRIDSLGRFKLKLSRPVRIARSHSLRRVRERAGR